MGGLYDVMGLYKVMGTRILWAPKSIKKWLRARFGFANHFSVIVFFISYAKWVQREKEFIYCTSTLTWLCFIKCYFRCFWCISMCFIHISNFILFFFLCSPYTSPYQPVLAMDSKIGNGYRFFEQLIQSLLSSASGLRGPFLLYIWELYLFLRRSSTNFILTS